MNPLKEIKNKLKKYPELNVIEDNSSITVSSETPNGFDVSFFDDETEYTVCFEGWHEHFEKNEKENAVNCFAFGLSDSCIMKVISRGGVDYKWIIQSFENGEWVTDSTTGLLWCRFWHKPVIRYLQNTVMKTKNT